MINSRDDWTLILPSERKETKTNGLDEYLRHWGKFVVLGEWAEIEGLVQKVNEYVESGRVPRAKYGATHRPGEYALFLYCDDRERHGVEGVLAELGVKEYFWNYDRETLREKLVR